MAKSRVRLDFVIDEEHYNKLVSLQNEYSKKTGINFNMTQTLIKTINDRYNLNITNEEILERN